MSLDPPPPVPPAAPPPAEDGPGVPLSPPLVALASDLEALRREGKRQFVVSWTGEGGWQVRWVGPVVRRSAALAQGN